MKPQRKGFYLFSQSGFVEAEVAVPFYVSGTGVSQASKGKIEQKRGILNQSSGFMWILSGALEVYDGPRLVPAERNHVCFSLAGEDLWHRVLSEECTFRWLTLAGPFAEAVLLSYRYARHQVAGHPYPEKLFRRLDALMNNDSPFHTRIKSAIVLEILAYAAGDDFRANENLRLLDNALTLIRRNLADPELGVAFLCERLNLSPATLNRLFRQRLDCSPGRVILDRRLRLGMGLLAGSDQSIAEIAGKCGFRNSKTFSRFIRRATGLNAREFRLRKRTGDTPLPALLSPPEEWGEDAAPAEIPDQRPENCGSFAASRQSSTVGV